MMHKNGLDADLNQALHLFLMYNCIPGVSLKLDHTTAQTTAHLKI